MYVTMSCNIIIRNIYIRECVCILTENVRIHQTAVLHTVAAAVVLLSVFGIILQKAIIIIVEKKNKTFKTDTREQRHNVVMVVVFRNEHNR